MADQKMCQQCGTLIDANDPSGLCAGCGKSASSDLGDGQHHIAPPLVQDDEPHGAEPMETFPTSPAGTSGYETNPELKVRR